MDLELEFSNSELMFKNSTGNFTVTETGVNISAEINKTLSSSCEEIIDLVFDVKSFGEMIPIEIKNIETIPALNFSITNGSVMQEGYYIFCENATTSKGENVFVDVILYSTENISSMNYSIQSAFEIVNAETTTGTINYTNQNIMHTFNMTNKSLEIAKLNYLIPLTAQDKTYELNLTNITADSEKKSQGQNNCYVVVETNCTDKDYDGYGVGEHCLTSTTILGGDCDDNDPYINPGEQELCNSKDDDCDGSIDEDGVCETPSSSGGAGSSGGGSGSSSSDSSSSEQSTTTETIPAVDSQTLEFASKFAEKKPEKQEKLQSVKTMQEVPSEEDKDNLISGLVGAENKVSLISGLTGMLVVIGAVLFIVYEVMKRKGKKGGKTKKLVVKVNNLNQRNPFN